MEDVETRNSSANASGSWTPLNQARLTTLVGMMTQAAKWLQICSILSMLYLVVAETEVSVDRSRQLIINDVLKLVDQRESPAAGGVVLIDRNDVLVAPALGVAAQR